MWTYLLTTLFRFRILFRILCFSSSHRFRFAVTWLWLWCFCFSLWATALASSRIHKSMDELFLKVFKNISFLNCIEKTSSYYSFHFNKCSNTNLLHFGNDWVIQLLLKLMKKLMKEEGWGGLKSNGFCTNTTIWWEKQNEKFQQFSSNIQNLFLSTSNFIIPSMLVNTEQLLTESSLTRAYDESMSFSLYELQLYSLEE